MLIDFSVKNYKSYKEGMTLSLAVGKKNVGFDSNFNKIGNLLNVAAIFGPNASGKTKLIEALLFMQETVVNSRNFNFSEKLDVTPYKLSQESLYEPTELEISFLIDDFIYQYGFACDKNEIYEEWLFATPKDGRQQKWIYRTKKDDKDNWYINPIIKGARKMWIDETRENMLLLSKIAYSENELIKPIGLWFENRLGIMNLIPAEVAIAKIHKNEKDKKQILEILKNADLSEIKGFKTVETDFNLSGLSKKMPHDIKEVITNRLKDRKGVEMFTIHSGENGEDVHFELSEESEGTIRMISFAGILLDILKNGNVIFFDELNNSLHFREVEYIVNIFKNPKLNPNNAQLIFTSHDTSIMNILPREEIYLTDKSKKSYTELYPLSDFENRTDVSLEKRYRNGFYGAVAKIKDFSDE